METQIQHTHVSPEGNQTQAFEFTSKEENLFYAGVFDIDPKELAELLKLHPEQIQLLDVRQKEEFHGELGRVPNSKLYVLDQLERTIHDFKKDAVIVFICRSGSRSARASEIALSLGYKKTYNLKGGMLLWNELRLPVELA